MSDYRNINRLTQFYGSGLWKCDRPRCASFYKGFESKSARDEHMLHHTRPFHCTRAGCHRSSFGFSSKKQLDDHTRFSHGELQEFEEGSVQSYPSIPDNFDEALENTVTNMPPPPSHAFLIAWETDESSETSSDSEEDRLYGTASSTTTINSMEAPSQHREERK